MLQAAPWGLRGLLNWIKDRYNNFPVLITENGYNGAQEDGTTDPGREGYYSVSVDPARCFVLLPRTNSTSAIFTDVHACPGQGHERRRLQRDWLHGVEPRGQPRVEQWILVRMMLHPPHANTLTFYFNLILIAHRQKYGLAYVDFNDPNRPRTLKQSARFIQEVTRTKYVRFVKPL